MISVKSCDYGFLQKYFNSLLENKIEEVHLYMNEEECLIWVKEKSNI